GQGRMRRLDHHRVVLVLDLPAAGDAAQTVGGHVVAGQHGEHAGRGERAGSVDRADCRMSPGRADEHGRGLPGELEVVGVPPLAEEEAAVLAALDGGAQTLSGHCALPWVRIVSAAVSTALTML